MLAPGSTFAHYRIEEVAGRGGMGVVYRATQIGLDRTVALKLITAELAEDAGFRERFKRESRMAASIEHPHVIPLYEAGECDECLFISMRYIEGTDLRRMIRDGPLEAERAVEIVRQIATALDSAHRRGLVHRDVKPANILVAEEDGEHAYLTDFGLTKRTTSAGGLTATGQFVGTADYTAPEQVMGKPTEARTDVYALGCVLFHALTGQTVYQRDSEVAIMYAHLNDPPPRATASVPDLPGGLDEVIERAMAKEPADRYPSAGDMGRAAARALGGQVPSQAERSVARGAARTGEPGAATDAAATRPEVAEPARPVDRSAEGPEAGARTRQTTRSRRRLSRPVALGVAAALGVGAVLAGVLLSGGGDDRDERPAAGESLASFPVQGSFHDVTARGGRVVVERKTRRGLRLSERREGRIVDLPPAPAYNYAGMEIGTDSVGRAVLIYSRCTGPRYTCQLYFYRFDTERTEVVRGISKRGCDETGPSISAGTITFARGWRGGTGPAASCQGGVFMKRAGRPAARLAGNPGSSDVNEPFVAWGMDIPPYRLRLARVSAPLTRQRRVRPASAGTSRGVGFLQPVLDGAFLYFVERVAGEKYVIARTRASLDRGAVERYRVVFTEVPAFTVSEGELLYSGTRSNGRGRGSLAHDKAPRFASL